MEPSMNRRQWLTWSTVPGAAGLPLLADRAAARQAGDKPVSPLKITDVQTILTAPARIRLVGNAPHPPEPDYEPVHGWTKRQSDDYLARNPGYRSTYEAELNCNVVMQ
jgi:hypothetical protein